MNTPNPSQAGPSKSATMSARYVVQTTDVLQDMRVTVAEEHSGKVIWYKERFLADDEIVENLVHNATGRIEWSIHRPLRGWYLRLRAPTFPRGVFIPLVPVLSTSPLHVEAAMEFTVRTAVPLSSYEPGPLSESLSTSTSMSSSTSASTHSYPPTPTLTSTSTGVSKTDPQASPTPALPVFPPSQSTPLSARTQLTQFVLAPSFTQHTDLTSQPKSSWSLLSRALQFIHAQTPVPDNSFTLSGVVSSHHSQANGTATPPPPYASNASLATIQPGASTLAFLPASQSSLPQPQAHTQPQLYQAPHHNKPLLTFHDTTPLLTVRSLSGVLEVDGVQEGVLGVATSFWIAVALAYLEFLEERESYLAALSD